MTTNSHYHDILNDLNPQHRDLRQMILPEVHRGFGEMSNAALASGDGQEIIGVVAGCDGCIASHARGAARASASKQEAAEAIGVGVSYPPSR